MSRTLSLRLPRYPIAVVAVGLALVGRFTDDPLVGDRQPFAFFYSETPPTVH
jgi:hypothetical protein